MLRVCRWRLAKEPQRHRLIGEPDEAELINAFAAALAAERAKREEVERERDQACEAAGVGLADVVEGVGAERDEWRHRAEAAEARGDALVAALLSLMEAGHFYDCLAGKRGGAPDDEACSPACRRLRAALALVEPTRDV